MTPDEVIEGFRELVRMLVEDGDVDADDAEKTVALLVEWHNSQKSAD